MTESQNRRLSRRDLLRYSAAGLVAVGSSSLLGACSSTEPGTGESTSGLMERAESGEPIRIAIGNEPPYTKLTADGELTGAAPDVAKAVLDRMGITEVEAVETAYDSMIPGLTANRWDMVAAGLFMNTSRCDAVLYSSPVIVSTESFALPPGNPKNISTLEDVKNSDVTVAALAGSFELKTAKSLGVPESKLQTYPRAPDALQGLDDGRVDAILLPTLSLQALKEQQNGDFEITEPLEAFPKTGSGAAFRPSDKEFQAKYNEELKAFKKTQEFEDILAKWGFDADAARDATTEELCKTKG
ncbi:MAG TPA: ectoine/hydroxyectoine ABC transporter substrate-binding protein EhuB [Nocardioidaceae bacterium]|nr:ectoine/hydroxyectoine ABC transporter substrate-binding protein EhuB [Nocardioidaceae bacterium]